VKIGDLEFIVSKETIFHFTKIPLLGEIWFKGMELDASHYKYFVKPQYKGKYGHTFQKNYLLNHYNKLLKVIQRYFTCEGHFSRVYQYHISLLMHFTSKRSLNLPYYLFKNLGKMVEKVQSKGEKHLPNLFHFVLIKLLVLNELDKMKMS